MRQGQPLMNLLLGVAVLAVLLAGILVLVHDPQAALIPLAGQTGG